MTFYFYIFVPAILTIILLIIQTANYFIEPKHFLTKKTLILVKILFSFSFMLFIINGHNMKQSLIYNFEAMFFIRVIKLLIFQFALAGFYYKFFIDKSKEGYYHNWAYLVIGLLILCSNFTILYF